MVAFGAERDGHLPQLPITANDLVSSPGEFHPEALAEPYVNVSIHTAPIIQPGKARQVTNAQTM